MNKVEETLIEIENEIEFVYAKIEQSNLALEKVILENRELNPLLMLYAKIILGKNI